MKDAIEFIRSVLPETDIQPLGGDMDIPFHFDTSALEQEIGYKPLPYDGTGIAGKH